MNVLSIKLSFLFLLVASFATAQTDKGYAARWKKIDSLIIKKKLPKSALAETKQLYALAKKEVNEPQRLKALIYLVDLQEETREDNILSSIKEVEAEAAQSKEPYTSLLNSMLAGLYWRYFQDHRWQLYDRTKTAVTGTDINSWGVPEFHHKITQLYLASINNRSLLQQTPAADLRNLIVKGNEFALRPTLYDLLANKAIAYFSNDEGEVTQAANHFEIDKAVAFAPVNEFINANFDTKDSTSLQSKALQLYQQLLRFHEADKDKNALIDADINRLQFVYQNAVAADKLNLYKAALQRTISNYAGYASIKQAQYLLAEYYHTQGSGYHPLKDTTNRFAKVEAVKILEPVVADSAVKNEGWANAFNLLQQLKKTTFSFTLEEVTLPGEPFRARVSYQNVSRMYLRLLPFTESIRAVWEEGNDDKKWTAITKAKPLKSWTQYLPETNDYQQHAVEIKIEALPVGEYLLLASADLSFKTGKATMAAQNFQVSNISYVNSGPKFFVLHRKTGQPLKGATVAFFRQEWNKKGNKEIKVRAGTYTTDARGLFQRAPSTGSDEFSLSIRTNNDRLHTNESVYIYRDDDNTTGDDKLAKVYFYTDRAIYRPGQKVYFKALLLNHIYQEYSVAAKHTGVVYLSDANRQAVDSVELKSNDYGSITGCFILPQNLLNGNFTISYGKNSDDNYTSFSVEEYKRPKFEVVFEKIKSAYQLFDTITITGNAKAFAGNIISGAKVAYTITRRNRFYYSYKTWLPDNSTQIKHGELTTDADGGFKISFPALADEKIDSADKPIFNYAIQATVTDLNGETHSSTTWANVGYTSVALTTYLPEQLPVDSFKQLTVNVANLNDENIPSKVTVRLLKLAPENRLIRSRLWDAPDQFIMAKDEYTQSFPHDEYKDETDFHVWPQTLVQEFTDSTHSDGTFLLHGLKALTAGHYKVDVITLDNKGREVKTTNHLVLFDNKAQGLVSPAYLWVMDNEQPIEPGEAKKIVIGSSADSVYLVTETDKAKTSKSETPIGTGSMSAGTKTFILTADEEDRGGYNGTFFFVKEGRVYQHNYFINVPWSNKELKTEFATFRNKTEPGTKETVTIKLSGAKGETVAAEMLASMYDASLDQFKEHQWMAPLIYPNSYNNIGWSGDDFRTVDAESNYIQLKEMYYSKVYDALLFERNGRQPLWWLNRWRFTYMLGMRDLTADEGKGVVIPPLTMETANFIGNIKPVDYVIRRELRPHKPIIRGGSWKDVGSYKEADYEADFYITAQKQNKFKNISDIDADGLGKKFDAHQYDPNFNKRTVAQNIQPRTNLSETAFFFPLLTTDEKGTIEFTFTAPEALTKWKLQTLAHTKDLQFGASEQELITQKQLMVQPNVPRFVRQWDSFTLQSKLANLSAKTVSGEARLLLFDAATNEAVDGAFSNAAAALLFTIPAGQSAVLNFPVHIPESFTSSLNWRIVASTNGGATTYSDGEEGTLPVLPNNMLLTETVPVVLKGSGSKELRMEKLIQSAGSTTIKQQSITIEATTNPAWYVVQALPYLMEFPYECAEQTWNRYYANALASLIAASSPRIQQVFEKWKHDTTALQSNLQKNEELKSVLLQETPWVLEGASEAEQRRNIALLFDTKNTSIELAKALAKLRQMQKANGAFPWFTDGPDNRYITQYIVTGMGRLLKTKALDKQRFNELQPILKKALTYLDKEAQSDYNALKKSNAKSSIITSDQVQYLYMRSFFPSYPISESTQPAYRLFMNEAAKQWQTQSKLSQGMIALALHRAGDKTTPRSILASLKESAIVSPESGMYWKQNEQRERWMWQESPIETEALLAEAFDEAGRDKEAVAGLRTWLIQNKQTNNWGTTKATADACFAVLLTNENLLNETGSVAITLGGATKNAVRFTSANAGEGTGYFKKTIAAKNIKPEMGNIFIESKNATTNLPVWANIYWQYFEDLDRITPAASPLQISKQIFIERTTDEGPELVAVTDTTTINVGDKLTIRLLLNADRDMEYIHLKDLRASGFEPLNVFSGYRWQAGAGYYETTKDASTSFFFDRLPKGHYVFEYPVYVSQSGTFSNGIATVQCMYAPQFAAHSEGGKVKVK